MNEYKQMETHKQKTNKKQKTNNNKKSKKKRKKRKKPVYLWNKEKTEWKQWTPRVKLNYMNGDRACWGDPDPAHSISNTSGVTNQSRSAHYVQKTSGVTSRALLTTFKIRV